MSSATYQRRNTTQRGYGHEHQQLRKRLLPLAYGTPCPKCGNTMLRGQALDLDHVVPIVLGGKHGPKRIAHRYCNRSAGSKLGNRLRARTRVSVTSRQW